MFFFAILKVEGEAFEVCDGVCGDSGYGIPEPTLAQPTEIPLARPTTLPENMDLNFWV